MYLYMSKQLNYVTGKGLPVEAKVTTNFQIKGVEKRNQKTLMVKTPSGTRISPRL